MADVFISYKRSDREWAERISQSLRDAGISCWWDTSLVAGEHFNQAIDRELKKCRCVVVIWSEAAHASRWVQAEALQGFERGILVATRLEDVSLTYPFSAIQTVDLRDGGVDAVVAGVQTKLGAPVVAPRKRLFTLVSVSSVLCLVASVALSVAASLNPDSDNPIYLMEVIGSWIAGLIGAIALFQVISRREGLGPLLGGAFAAAVAFGLMILIGNWAEGTPYEYKAPLLFFPLATMALAALGALLARKRR